MESYIAEERNPVDVFLAIFRSKRYVSRYIGNGNGGFVTSRIGNDAITEQP